MWCVRKVLRGIFKMSPNIRLSCVAAIANNRGIGKNGDLPWRIRGDMKFFVKITTQVKTEGKQNAVIMGRKTWESIPEKHRPLPRRFNIVLSKTMSSPEDGSYSVMTSLDEAVEKLSSPPLSQTIENVYVIGGAAAYKLTAASSLCHRLYLTHVMKDFDYIHSSQNLIQVFSNLSVQMDEVGRQEIRKATLVQTQIDKVKSIKRK